MPTWAWYVIGAVIFVAIFLYIKSSGGPTVGQTVVVPNTQDLANYNGSADILANVLGMQKPVINHLAAGNATTNK